MLAMLGRLTEGVEAGEVCPGLPKGVPASPSRRRRLGCRVHDETRRVPLTLRALEALGAVGHLGWLGADGAVRRLSVVGRARVP